MTALLPHQHHEHNICSNYTRPNKLAD